MTALRTAVIAMRASPTQKARFAALASRHGLSESALLRRLVDAVLDCNGVPTDQTARPVESAVMRIRLRLKDGDHALLQTRAAARQMKPASYLQALVRSHVRGSAPMPAAELNLLKLAVARLASIDRQLERFGSAPSPDELRGWLETTRSCVDDVRQGVADMVRTHLISWEAGDG